MIEAVPGVPDIRTGVNREMTGLLRPHNIIATNFPTLLPRDFAAATGRPEKYCAMHFANLIWALNLVEIMANAAYVKERFLDKGPQGMMGGEGFYRYPNPADAAPGFLAVPDASVVTEVVARAMLK